MGKEAERNEHIKKKYANRFEELIKGKTQAEKEAVLIGEKYVLGSHLAQAKEQIIESENRMSIIGKFMIINNKLAFDGMICEEGL
jgi:hypothetical protein